MMAFCIGTIVGMVVMFLVAVFKQDKIVDSIWTESETAQELVALLLEKMETDPDGWECSKYGTESHWFQHPSNGVFINTNSGHLSGAQSSGRIPLKEATEEKLYQAVCDLKAHRAVRKTLRFDMKAT